MLSNIFYNIFYLQIYLHCLTPRCSAQTFWLSFLSLTPEERYYYEIEI